MSIVEFLLARIAEDEALAKLYAEHHDPLFIDDDGRTEWLDGLWDDGTFYLPNRHTTWDRLYDPARVLAECAAKRWVLDTLRSYEPDTEWRTEPDMGKRGNNAAGAVRQLAAVYAEHEDYREEWAL
ncbi:hypothetical protein SCMU_14680 [Sinomonas cyclohexanicum]|uniref:Uncharacterized protein n=1 Tax=Sinomonas cyclohexanicum TaxID=322009 RepID=A0ABM7PTR4_SINCY|nr:DUF6221 family protein [Corynebacterium cyclohexanicum]BCT75626.1 hypothetical protein SCMU_14680 [Corynebacterium cyclohexanicum]